MPAASREYHHEAPLEPCDWKNGLRVEGPLATYALPKRFPGRPVSDSFRANTGSRDFISHPLRCRRVTT